MRRDIFQALADPTRRAILLLIAGHSMTPNALAHHFNTTRQAVSNHIRILTECELLTSQKNGREIMYHFNQPKMKDIDIWLDQLKKQWESRYDQLDNLLTNIKTNNE